MTGASEDPVARDTEELMDLVGAIYDTVLDRTIWPDVLKKLSLFVEGAASAVFWEDGVSNQGDVYFYDGGIPPHYKDLYFRKYVGLNPITIPRLFTNVDEPIATGENFSDAFLSRVGAATRPGRFRQHHFGKDSGESRHVWRLPSRAQWEGR
jgi:hypothetical protein